MPNPKQFQFNQNTFQSIVNLSNVDKLKSWQEFLLFLKIAKLCMTLTLNLLKE